MKNAIPVLVAVLILSGCSGPDRDTNTTPQPTTPNDTPTHTSQQAHTSAPAPPKPPAAETAPATIAPAPAPVPAHAPETAGTVHPGAFCDGGTGVSKTGKPMICAPAADGRNRWQAA